MSEIAALTKRGVGIVGKVATSSIGRADAKHGTHTDALIITIIILITIIVVIITTIILIITIIILIIVIIIIITVMVIILIMTSTSQLP